MGLLSAAMLAEVKDPGGKVYFGLEIDLPDGTTLRYAEEFLLTDAGTYHGTVTEFGEIPKMTSRWDMSVEAATIQVSIADESRTLSKLIGGEYEGRLEGAASRVKMLSPNVSSADWYTAFSGKFITWGAVGITPTISITIGHNDKPLQGGAKLGRITTTLYANVGDDVVDTPIAAVYGSQARTAGGAVTAYRVSATEWLVSAGFVEDITEVYEDEFVSTSSWSYQQSTRKGRALSEIVFTADPGDVDITCDVEGLTASGDGTGTAITNPATQLEHALVNFYFNRWESGAYYTADSTELNATYFGNVETWLTANSWTGRLVVNEETTGYQLINTFAAAWRVPVFFTSDGAVGMLVDEFYLWKDTQDTLYESKLLSESATENIKDVLADEIAVSHGYYDAEGKTTDETKARDLSRSYDVAKSIEQTWNID